MSKPTYELVLSKENIELLEEILYEEVESSYDQSESYKTRVRELFDMLTELKGKTRETTE